MDMMLEFSAGTRPIFGVAEKGGGVAVAPLLPELDAFGRCALLSDVDGTAQGFV